MKRLAMLLVAAAATGALAGDDALPTRLAALSGRPVTAPDGVTSAEEVLLDLDLLPALLAIGLEESIRVVGWPLAPGLRRDLVLTRHDVYAADARLFVADGEAYREVPRSKLVFFRGETEDREVPVVVAVDPEARTLHGYADGPEGWVEILPAGAGREEYLVAPSFALAGPGTAPLEYGCGQAGLPMAEMAPADRPGATPDLLGTLRKATLAVDTDNELLLLKFADNTTSATNYIASLFALMTTAYERDLAVRLLQGTTFLRVSSTPDPWELSGSGGADSAKLDEFREYWIDNYAAIPRAAAMMLSGKQGSPNSSSGIGYVNSLCSFTTGYTFTQVFKFAGSTAASDLKVVAHENGHNFGSRHTHCYLDPTPIDTCHNTESGCYAGATSCPDPVTINGVPNVRGTVMSYCHFLGGCTSTTVFHPRTVEILEPLVESKVGVCVFALANPKEASPAGDLEAQRGAGTSVSVTYTPGCAASQHTVYAGSLGTLQAGGLSWSQRYCALGTSGSLTFNPGAASVYFVVAANDGSIEGSYGQATTGERPPAGPGPVCQYTQDLSGTCP